MSIPLPKQMIHESFDELAARIRRDDPYLVDYLLGWAGKGDPQPWGAATSFALEVAHGYGLIRGESDPSITSMGAAVVALLAQGTEAGTAATENTGAVHDGPVAESHAPKPHGTDQQEQGL